jgi:penicillin-binding protein 1C
MTKLAENLRARAPIAVSIGGALVLALSAWFSSFEIDRALFDPASGGPIVVVDRHGEVLRRVPSSDGRPGREGWVALSDVSSHAILTLLASEDQTFYEHGGIDLPALGRALWLTLTTERTYGGSTLTMQLARLVYSRGKDRTVGAKLAEMRAAIALERTYSKDELLEQYLNRAYYGHGAYGIEAAAQRYFARPAKSLSVGEATFLAVLPRGPSYYDPVRHFDRVLERRDHLFELLIRQGRLSRAEAERATAQRIELAASHQPFHAPHFVDYVLAELPDDVRARGGTIHTTLDLRLQALAERRTADHARAQADYGVESAAVVVLDAERAEVLAMVGSPDYARDAINMATWRRYPGSALKPFVYATAIEERGMAPSTVAYDALDISRTYRVPNGREHGPVSFRTALASSYNFAAVHTLETIGQGRVIDRLRLAGVSDLELAPSEYGSRLALGSTRVRLIDLAASYRFTVHDGAVVAPTGIREARDGDTVVFRPSRTERAIFSPETSWLVMDMLADPEARRPMFGHELPVDLPYPVVAKTGTAEGFSDTVAVIATEELIVAAWTGRTDGGAIEGRAGMQTAAPLARAALLAASRGRDLHLPRAPSGIVRADVCPLSGERAAEHCPHRRLDWFRAGTVPTETCDWHTEEGIRYPGPLEGWERRGARVAAR